MTSSGFNGAYLKIYLRRDFDSEIQGRYTSDFQGFLLSDYVIALFNFNFVRCK